MRTNLCGPLSAQVLRADKNLDAPYMSVARFEEAWQQYPPHKAMLEDLAVPFDKEKCDPLSLAKTRYAVSGAARPSFTIPHLACSITCRRSFYLVLTCHVPLVETHAGSISIAMPPFGVL